MRLPFLNNPAKEYKHARIIVKKTYWQEYLQGKQGRIISFYKDNKRLFCNLKLVLDGHPYFISLPFDQLMLEEPEDYPKLPKAMLNPRMRGGVNMLGSMPRALRFLIFLAIVVLVWHVVLNIDSIMWFIMHNLVLKK